MGRSAVGESKMYVGRETWGTGNEKRDLITMLAVFLVEPAMIRE